MLGQGPEIGRLRVHVIHVSGEFSQKLFFLCLGHPTKTNGWEKTNKQTVENPQIPDPTCLKSLLISVGLLGSVWELKAWSLFSVFRFVSAGHYDHFQHSFMFIILTDGNVKNEAFAPSNFSKHQIVPLKTKTGLCIAWRATLLYIACFRSSAHFQRYLTVGQSSLGTCRQNLNTWFCVVLMGTLSKIKPPSLGMHVTNDTAAFQQIA